MLAGLCYSTERSLQLELASVGAAQFSAVAVLAGLLAVAKGSLRYESQTAASDFVRWMRQVTFEAMYPASPISLSLLRSIPWDRPVGCRERHGSLGDRPAVRCGCFGWVGRGAWRVAGWRVWGGAGARGPRTA